MRPARLMIAAGLAACALATGLLVLAGRFDRAAPVLQLDPQHDSDRPHRGRFSFSLTADDARPGLAQVTASSNDGLAVRVLASSTPGVFHCEVDTTAFVDGPHTVVIRARDRALWPNTAELSVALMVDNTPPRLELASPSVAARQGSTAVVFARADEPLASCDVSVLDRKLPCRELEGGWFRALVGVPVAAPAGETSLLVTARDRAGNSSETGGSLVIEEVPWPRRGFIQLTRDQVLAQGEREAIEVANARRSAAYGRDLGRQAWSGSFQLPVDGRLTSSFGLYRQYSTGARRHHLGIDLAAPSGTPVVAPAAGVIALADELQLYGNAVILNHGHGVSTSYNHLHSISVAPGQLVEAGSLLGTVGSTGQSTGPHLHWGMVVAGVSVDPLEWTHQEWIDSLQPPADPL